MATLPNFPFTDIQDTRVAPNAPVSTDLLTDFVVNCNYLKSAVDLLGGSVQAIFFANNTWTAPAGITKIKVTMRGPGGGGGGGADNSFNGGGGGDGSPCYFDNVAQLARGGKGGLGGVVATPAGPAAAASLTPILTTISLQFGSRATTAHLGNGFGDQATNEIFVGGLLASAAGIGPTFNGNAGQANTGQGGGGGGGSSAANGGGSPGGPGELAVWWITVVPGVTYNVIVPGGGTGGVKGGGGSSGNGGAGGSASMVIEY